jgi:hypothetical protein
MWRARIVASCAGVRELGRVERVVLAPQPPLATAGTTDFMQPLLAPSQIAGEPGPVMGRSFDRPDTHARGVLVGEADGLPRAAAIGANRPLRNERPAGRGHDRERVLISVRVDTDHVIHLVCEHPDRSSVHS